MTLISKRMHWWILAAVVVVVVGAVALPRLSLPGFPHLMPQWETTEAQSASSVESAVFSGIRSMMALRCAEYTGAVYLRQEAPLHLLGIRITDASVWLHARGVVRTSIDLSRLSRDDVSMEWRLGRPVIHIRNLPQPQIVGCEIDPDGSLRGRTLFMPWGGDARTVAEVQDSLLVQAQDSIISQAVESGLLSGAEAHARITLAHLTRQLLGDPSIDVLINFRQEIQ
jgi:hypothetical protein